VIQAENGRLTGTWLEPDDEIVGRLLGSAVQGMPTR